MTTRAQRARTRKATLTAQYGRDHPLTVAVDDELALYRAAAAIKRNRRSSWTSQQKVWLRQLVNGCAPFGNDLSEPMTWNARASGPPGEIPGDGNDS